MLAQQLDHTHKNIRYLDFPTPLATSIIYLCPFYTIKTTFIKAEKTLKYVVLEGRQPLC